MVSQERAAGSEMCLFPIMVAEIGMGFDRQYMDRSHHKKKGAMCQLESNVTLCYSIWASIQSKMTDG
jgi:hypothetical protein